MRLLKRIRFTAISLILCIALGWLVPFIAPTLTAGARNLHDYWVLTNGLV